MESDIKLIEIKMNNMFISRLPSFLYFEISASANEYS